MRGDALAGCALLLNALPSAAHRALGFFGTDKSVVHTPERLNPGDITVRLRLEGQTACIASRRLFP